MIIHIKLASQLIPKHFILSQGIITTLTLNQIKFISNVDVSHTLKNKQTTYFPLIEQAMAIIQMVGVDRMCSIMAVDNEEIALATCNLFQCINDSLTGGDKREYGKEEALVLGETDRF